jgi:hypothetical protein
MPQARGLVKWLADWRIAVAFCIGLLLLRSWFFVAWEESFFDSDQAIVGLMAKHLVEGRAKPLFFYGQEYMLAVESWVAAPFIGLFGASVATLRTALVTLNLVTGLLLVRLLVTEAGLGVWPAVLVSSIFWIAPMAVASDLVEAQGGNIEPFLWVLVAWMLRRRPLALGACLAVAVLNREFSAYAIPMLLLVDVIERHSRVREMALDWTQTLAAFLIVFTAVEFLKPYADLFGPGTAGELVGTGGQDTVTLALARVRWNASELGLRFYDLASDYVPTILGLKTFNPGAVGVATDLRVGRVLLGPIVAVLSVIAAALLWADARRTLSAGRRWLFPLYLTGVGVIAAVAYPLTRPLIIHTLRYGLLSLYAPIGIAALMLQPMRRVALRLTAAAILGLLAVSSAIDHARVLVHARHAPPPTPMRDILSRIEAHRVTVAFADYWLAYHMTFLSGEKVKFVANDFERITEYKALAGRPVDAISPGGVLMVQKNPCATGAGERVAGYYLCDWR